MKITVFLLVMTSVVKVCFARSVCQDIADDVGGNFGLQEVNECYRCQGWYKVGGEASSASSSYPIQREDGIFWCAISKDYLDVIFDEPTKLAGLRINVSIDNARDTAFHVYYVDENGEKFYARSRSRNNLFGGNAEGGNIREYSFFIPVTAISVRLHVESNQSRNCLVVQFYSCDHTEGNSIAAGQRNRHNYAYADYHGNGKRTFRGHRRRNSCSINVKRDCGDLQCFQYLKDEVGCQRCECDNNFNGYMEGDIHIDSFTRDAAELEYGFRKDPGNLMRNGITHQQSRWVDYPSGSHYIIPYAFDSSIEKWAQDKIVEAMREMQSVTCLKFEPRSSQEYYLDFYRGGGCSSYIGNIRRAGGQKISIGNGCEHISIVQHEILHALGFWHEQSRGDRDDYVRILEENIKSGAEGNFEKRQTNNYGSPYDFQSVMHYGNKAFSSNGEDTIQAINDPELRLGTSNVMTTEDINQVNKMYQCQTTSSTAGTTTTGRETTTIATTPTTPTAASTTTTVSACEDEYQSCSYWTYLGYCKKEYVGFMRDHCKKSCGHCECQDMFDCSLIEDLCQNASEGTKAFMLRNCPRTCNLC